MNDHLIKSLNHAMDQEFGWLDHFSNPYEEHAFSDQFESNMLKILNKSEYSYVSVGHRRLRKSLLAILIALFLLAVSGCAFVTKYLVEWNEAQNDTQGTLDVTFDVDKNASRADPKFISPVTPNGYDIISTSQDLTTYSIEYKNASGELIMYSQDSDIENMSISIDNENADFKELTINGHKGYSYKKEDLNALLWTDGTYFYTLQGTCPMSILKEMSESLDIQ